MAAQWGAGKETLTACNMDFFPLDTLSETPELCPGGTLEALQSCLDPSILSIFDDNPSMETKGLDEDSEATLLTALTEILDNVDDENLSPFDTLPESDLLSSHKGREHSPLRRLLCMPRSPSEKGMSLSARPLSAGKNLSRIPVDSLQRSDGEEEEAGSLTRSPVRHGLPPDWEGVTLPFPVTFEQESDDGLSVSLGDLVRHMHPYCMAICVENDEGVQMLPEGGILLEVVDQGENGEPILVVPDMDLPGLIPLEEKLAGEEEVASDTSQHIVVDDDDYINVLSKTPGNIPGSFSEEMINKQKEETLARVPSRRKKKKKKHCPLELVEGRVLRSTTVRNQMQELPQKPEKRPPKEEKNNIAKAPAAPVPLALKSKKIICQSEAQAEISNPETSVKAMFVTPRQHTGPAKAGAPESPFTSQQPNEMFKQVSQATNELCSQPPLVSPSSHAASSNSTASTVSEPLPPAAPAFPESKPKSLSLAEYRRLRLQKKPVMVEKQGDNSTKWPSLPEPPKELTPIPCLPDPYLRDPRRPTTQAARREVVEMKPAWQPRGPCAPPTPEALLVPPAYMAASANKSGTATSKSQESQAVSTPKCAVPQKPSAGTPDVVNPPPPTSECQPVNKSPDRKSAPKLSDAQFAKISSQTTSEMVSSAVLPVADRLQKTTISQKGPEVIPPTSLNNLSTSAKSPTVNAKRCSAPSLALHSLKSQAIVLEANQKVSAPVEPPKAKSPTQELVESFTSEIGIEAADLTSLLEQFEETQAKEQQSVPEVCGRAAAVGNSSAEFAREKIVVERVRANDLSSPAALTPPATPPHQMWKPLAPVALLRKANVPLSSKTSLSKAIQIEARPLPSARFHSKPTAASATVSHCVVCMDHDYCLPSKVTPQSASQSNTQSPEALDHAMERSSVLETPEASPARQDNESTFKENTARKGPFERSYGCYASSRTLSPKERGRKRTARRSPSVSSSIESDSHSSRSRSRSHSPSKKRYRHRCSRSRSGYSSRSSSRSSVSRSPPRRRRYSYSSSHSGSWSRSRSRSQSPQRCAQWRRNRRLCSPSYRSTYGHCENAEDVKRRKEKAIEERRVVYIGRILGTMTQRELRERFSYFGKVEDCTLHFRDRGDNYGFVTYYNTKDAFTAIENGSKLRKPDELPFDLCFGGRRQFCKTSYSDLDSNREYNPPSAKSKVKTLDFDTLLRQAQQSLKR
ncbi:peroxisome proliferator-activated receptor gamma coactivator-related protein 1 isoform X2 [Dunckerocampus dactyliophorus]|uniref:peroxisome proliferator-activated receptor gamma coactivator-related protein 1 isoform X2 n=1 Tax=Dunckerocampus dactyliophorus TaxID=161453 RepID=UPI00240697CA|nr:peroxisome proliferator-activated receptor gamma coactivator-related protein 1 isoform X2 [Dunckerocampus dactyliophorus]